MSQVRIALICLALPLTMLVAPSGAAASRGQWSMFEDHTKLVRAPSPQARAARLQEVRALGADTLRIEVKWSDVAPGPQARNKPNFNAADPGAYAADPHAYPGFFPYDDLVRQARVLGMRVLMTITGDTPRWASAGGRSTGFETANYSPSPTEYANFAAAVAKRYSGKFLDLPPVYYFSIWNEPNHKYFLKPASDAPRIYRNLVDAAVPAIRANAASGAKVLVGELAPVGRAPKVIGPTLFFRQWLCLDKRFRATRKGPGCSSFKKIAAGGFAHHPYGPVDRVPKTRDTINMLAIRSLAKYIDRAAKARRLPFGLSIYNTEFGLQSNPPDTSVSTTPLAQARILNEKEEYSYRYSRLKSYSQYLLTDDPARKGPKSQRWSGFQTGLRFPNGKKKPSYDAYKFPIVVHKRGRRGVKIWGRVRPGAGIRSVRIERRRGGGFKKESSRVGTNSKGYFTIKRHTVAAYRFQAYDGPGSHAKALGRSRTASPIR
jgi:hypothetical protein